MSRTTYAFSVLQATAAVASLAIIMWSLGFPVLQFANAANVTSFSDTMSSTLPSAASDHIISYTADAGVAPGGTIVLTFDAGFTGISSLTAADVDLNIGGADVTVAAAPSGATWGVAFGANTITFTSGTDEVLASEAVVIEVGTVAGGTNQITNPAKVAAAGTADTYELNLTSGATDTGETRLVIIDAVQVTAAVDTIFTFTVSGVAGGVNVNGTDTTGGPSTSTEIPFGELQNGVASTAAQQLAVSTNASNGFVVTVSADQQLTNGNGDDIDGFVDGSFTTTPTAWAAPSGTPGSENTYGHWGISSDDTTLTGGLSNLYTGGVNFVSASSSPVEVFRHDNPINGTGAGQGTTTVIYKAEVSALQEAATDYTATLTYVATPVF